MVLKFTVRRADTLLNLQSASALITVNAFAPTPSYSINSCTPKVLPGAALIGFMTVRVVQRIAR
jgi:hypothetical protein